MKGKIILASLAFLCILPHSLFAYGFGAYGTISPDITSFHGISSGSSGGGGNLKADYSLGFGLVLDSAVAKNERFNYRLSLEYNNMISWGNRFFDSYSRNTVMMINTFGFALWTSKFMRLWMGPELVLGYKFYSRSDRYFYPASIFGSNAYRSRVESERIGIANIGAVLGINFNMGSAFTILFETGLRGGMSIGNYERKEKGFTYLYNVALPINKDSSYDSGGGNIDFFAKVGFMFRVRDRYADTGKPDKAKKSYEMITSLEGN